MTSREALVALNMLPKIGPIRVRRLMERFGAAEPILRAPTSQLISVEGIGPETAGVIHGWENRIDLASELREAEERGISIITQEDSTYPEALRQSYDPPLLLYVWGELTEADRHAIAIVGSRKTTHYGIQTARQFAFQLAASGMTIISGLARGIDTHAHEGAVAAKGRTIAVIGSGLGQIYPPENMDLAGKITAGHGAVVSEFPLNTTPSKQTFPMRNRIVAAWPQAVLVVECPEWSGARITANLAAELGKPVHAIPGPIDRPSSAGCHALIREGATLVTKGQDILDDLSVLPPGSIALPDRETPPRPPLEPSAQSVINALQNGPAPVDELLHTTTLPLPEINVQLLKLEIQGLIKQLPGNRYTLK